MPWAIDTNTHSRPENRVMTGRVVAIEVAPPEHIGARGPKPRTMSGAANKVIISRNMLASSAIVPSSAAACAPIEASFSEVMSIDESE